MIVRHSDRNEWQIRLVQKLCFIAGCVIVVLFYRVISAQEEALQNQAHMHVRERIDAWQQWSTWQPSQPISALQAKIPPLDEAVGRPLLTRRFIPSESQRLPVTLRAALDNWHFPVLIWYQGVPPDILENGELRQRALSRTPFYMLKGLLPELEINDPLILNPTSRRLVQSRCPAGCLAYLPADVEARVARLQQRLLALLDAPERSHVLAALALLIQSEEEAIPLLEQRLAQSEPANGRLLAFMGLMELLEPEARERLLTQTLKSGTPALQMLAMLEVLRRPDESLLPLPESTAKGIPGSYIVHDYVMEMLKWTPTEGAGIVPGGG